MATLFIIDSTIQRTISLSKGGGGRRKTFENFFCNSELSCCNLIPLAVSNLSLDLDFFKGLPKKKPKQN